MNNHEHQRTHGRADKVLSYLMDKKHLQKQDVLISTIPKHNEAIMMIDVVVTISDQTRIPKLVVIVDITVTVVIVVIDAVILVEVIVKMIIVAVEIIQINLNVLINHIMNKRLTMTYLTSESIINLLIYKLMSMRLNKKSIKNIHFF